MNLRISHCNFRRNAVPGTSWEPWNLVNRFPVPALIRGRNRNGTRGILGSTTPFQTTATNASKWRERQEHFLFMEVPYKRNLFNSFRVMELRYHDFNKSLTHRPQSRPLVGLVARMANLPGIVPEFTPEAAQSRTGGRNEA